MEMWCALTLQTPPTATLVRYLPAVKLAPRAGCHLNVASPLSQSYVPGYLDPGDMEKSTDSLVVRFLNDRRQQYMALRYSDDPILREYWWETHRQGLAT